ncbi:nucleotidyltransferase domain-containing protein [Candidatus Babeliales bacterium]|nr:nucleotidyltransferase domain-containing protein [Candidatus Babeliales bacterium]
MEKKKEQPQIDLEAKTKIIRLVQAILPEAKIYLFGSYGRGTQNRYSDIDIAIDVGKVAPDGSVDEIKEVVGAAYIYPKVDVVDYRLADESFKEEIDKDMVIWKN